MKRDACDDDSSHVTEHMPVIHPGRGEHRLWLWVMPTQLREEETSCSSGTPVTG